MLRLGLLLLVPTVAHAGLHYSGETPAELPAQWRGFLLDHRGVRLIGLPPAPGTPLHQLREQYLDAADKLEAVTKSRTLTADEAADLGALYVRLGKPGKAVEDLRPAARANPDHFRIAANLGTAWQAQGELAEAVRALEEAVRLAPPRWKKVEQAHLKLVRGRVGEGKTATTLDDLFGVTIETANRKKLPADDVAIVQQLALWLPSDARLLWQLAELTNAHGDVRTAAAILDGVVTEFAFTAPAVRDRRKAFRTAADEIAKLPDAEHAKYRGDIAFKSPRPLVRALDTTRLPEIRPDGVNPLPWSVLAETTVAPVFKPKFHEHLKKLDGKRVSLTGYMQPVSMDFEVGGFMLIEFPVGCWFCETPEPAGILYVEIGGGKSVAVKRGRVKVEGVLKLNATDAEDFLYTVTGATVRDPD